MNYFIILILLALSTLQVSAQELRITKSVIQFGDNRDWIEPRFDDSNWSSIQLQKPWEDQGYYDKDGYAWYRIHFDAFSVDVNSWYEISIGRIDDADITFLNGEEIGRTGNFPPNYVTAYHEFRSYLVHGSLLLIKGNVLSIRVYDERLYGGWLEGELELTKEKDSDNILSLLPNHWKFKLGDNLNWKEVDFNDSNWDTIRSGESWETQGFANRDGFAWYRMQISLPENITNTDLTLDLGFIDDADQVFINGELIGETGRFLGNKVEYDDYAYQERRLYSIPKYFIKSEERITIAIRVYDGFNDGGLYSGTPKLLFSDEPKSIIQRLLDLFKQ